MQLSNRVEKRLAELVAMDTRNPGGDEKPLAAKLVRELAELGANKSELLIVDGHASAFARFGTKSPTLIFNAHIDTVPASPGSGADPFLLVRRGQRLHGLGSADTKGSIAAILEALALCKEQGRKVEGIAVLFSGDEELGGLCIREFLGSERCRGLERAFVCEPSGCRVGTRHRGVYAARISATSTGGHSSLADSTANPLAALARAAMNLDDLGRRYRTIGPEGLRGLCMNIAALEGGVAFNIIPARATLTFSMRPAPGLESDAIVQAAREAVTAAVDSLPVVWQPLASNPPFETQNLAAFAPLLGELAQHPIDLPYGTEAGQFVAAGIDAVVFGPGRIEQAHKADEYVDLDELVQAVRVYSKAIS